MIRVACVKLDAKEVVSLSSFRKVVGCGTDTRFWLDIWLGDLSLAVVFPRLFRLEQHPGCLVSDRHVNGVWGWNWRRNLRGGVESAQFMGLIDKLAGWVSSPDRDRWMWSMDPNGDFSVALVRKMVDDSELPNSFNPTRWCKDVPRKVNIHVWRVLNDRLPSRMALDRRGIDIPDILCPLCGIEAENLDHIFIRCEVAARTWNAIFRWLDCILPDTSTCLGWFLWLDALRMGNNQKRIIETVLMAGLWLLWKFRNDQVFGKKRMRKDELIDGIKDVAFLWLCNRRKSFSSKWVSWLTNPLTLM